MERAGVPCSVALKLTGHKTEAAYRRYAIVCEADMSEGLKKLDRVEDAVRGAVQPMGCKMSLATLQGQKVRITRENMAEGARFETTDAPETICPDLAVSALSESFTKIKGR